MDGVVPVAGRGTGPVEPPTAENAWGGTMAPAPSRSVMPADRPTLSVSARRLPGRRLAGVSGPTAATPAWSFLLAVPCCAFIVAAVILGLGLSFSFAGMLVGVPLLVVSLDAARWLGAGCRGLAGRLLRVRVATPPPLAARPGIAGWGPGGADRPGGLARLRLPAAQATGRAARHHRGGLPVAVRAALPDLSPVVADRARCGDPETFVAFLVDGRPVAGGGRDSTLPGALALVPVGAVVLLAIPWLTRAVNGWDEALIARLLGPVSLPQRVRELERTRARAVDDSAARLRMIERDLHDGAQAQMVAVAMKLGMARVRLGDAAGGTAQVDLERARELVSAAHRSAKEAITELRELARGIHPAVLDSGLGPALTALAAGSAVPVSVKVDLAERPSPAIETIAYFCAAELLVNMAKHSGAQQATLEAVHSPGLLRVRVTDDGAGGAGLTPGGGLAGLLDRVLTVDGTLEVSSPPGGPTVVSVELPSHA